MALRTITMTCGSHSISADSADIGCCPQSRVSLKPSLRKLCLNRSICLRRCGTGKSSSEEAVRGGWHFEGGCEVGGRDLGEIGQGEVDSARS